VTGRAGLVGTQNVRNNQSRVGGLDHVVKSGTIVEAVDNQPWSGEANVHVSIVNWVKTQDKNLLPPKRRLWYKVDPSLPLLEGTAASRGRRATSTPGKRRATRKDKSFELAYRESESINSALSDQRDVSVARVLAANREPPRVFNGQFPRHQGFVLKPYEAAELIAKNRRNREVVHPYLIGQEMLTHGAPQRWIIDFQKMSLLDAKAYAAPFARVEAIVLPHIQAYAKREKHKTGKATGQDQTWLRTWWQHFRCRKEMVDQIEKLPRYLACAEVTKRPIFCFLDPCIRPDHTLEAFILADDYSFGLLQSNVHWLWFTTKCSKLTERFRYTPESVFDTFPWPQSPTAKQIDAVAQAGREVRRVREHALTKIRGGLRAVYRTLELPGKNPLKDAHAALDAAVLAAYGFSAKKDLLEQLLALNLEVARRIDAGQSVTAPGIPPGYRAPARLVTADCVRADQ
jgi:hypothetical protein